MEQTSEQAANMVLEIAVRLTWSIKRGFSGFQSAQNLIV
jgi:hypothetical protein